MLSLALDKAVAVARLSTKQFFVAWIVVPSLTEPISRTKRRSDRSLASEYLWRKVLPNEREVLEILDGLKIEIMVSSKSSNNTCCVFVETTPPGSGPPPHKHLREEEIFTALEGSYEFYLDGAWHPMEIGSSRFSPRDTFHAFKNVGDTPGRMMLVTTRGGIDDYFRAISKLKMPEDATRFEELNEHYGYVYQSPS